MASDLFFQCPLCHGQLKISSLTCCECGMEYRGEFEPETNAFSQLSPEQKMFLTTFLKCRGNLSQVQIELEISYPTAKRRLDDVLYMLGLCEKDEAEFKNREVIDVKLWQVDEDSTKPAEIVKRKLKESGGRATVTSYSGKQYEIWAEPDGQSFGCDALHNVVYTYDIFDIVVDFLERSGGRAKKGTAHARLGSEKCGVDTIAGVILQDYFGVPLGGSGFDPSFAIIAILAWAGILQNGRGYVELTAQYWVKRSGGEG